LYKGFKLAITTSPFSFQKETIDIIYKYIYIYIFYRLVSYLGFLNDWCHILNQLIFQFRPHPLHHLVYHHLHYLQYLSHHHTWFCEACLILIHKFDFLFILILFYSYYFIIRLMFQLLSKQYMDTFSFIGTILSLINPILPMVESNHKINMAILYLFYVTYYMLYYQILIIHLIPLH